MPWHEMLRNGCENGEPYSVGSDVKPLLLGVVVRSVSHLNHSFCDGGLGKLLFWCSGTGGNYVLQL